MPRFRFTVRRMMVAVAIVGLLSGNLIERHTRFRRMAAQHADEKSRQFSFGYSLMDDLEIDRLIERKAARYQWHEGLELKYERAALSPWLPVAPDPPEPR